MDVVNYVVVSRIRELLFGKFGKFLVVGGLGFVINYVVLRFFSEVYHWDHSLANLLGAAIAIFSNYNLNNFWTFKDGKITGVFSYISKLIQFYLTSAFGVIFIQTGVIFLGDKLISEKYYQIYFIIGTSFLLIWNFAMYNLVIWKKKK